jgi:hypothetical protein
MSPFGTPNGGCMRAGECRSWEKSGRAADITAMTEFDPLCDISAQFLL